MLYRLRDLPAMLATPYGRRQVRDGVAHRLWPSLSGIAARYRRAVVGRTRVVAVVGSFGKSTTVRAIAAALDLPSHPRMLLNAVAAVAFAVLRIRAGQPRAVIEVGIAAPGEMDRYARLVRPDVTVVTTVGSEHLRELGTLDDTRNEKAAMVRALATSGTAVLNGDDPRVLWMAGQTQARVVTFGFGAACDVRAQEPILDWPAGMRVRVVAFGEARDVALRLLGRHMVYPALAAIAVARVEGLDLDAAIARLQGLPPTSGRLEPVALPNGVVVLRDDFKTAIEAMDAALDLFAEVPARRRIAVLGDALEPPLDTDLHYPVVGARVAGIAAHLVVVGRGLADYATGALQAGMPAAAIHDGGTTPQQAAAVLRALLEPGDVVLIKGRRPQMLDRVRLLLQGERVGCAVTYCDLRGLPCVECPMRAEGWGTRRMIVRRGAVT